MADAPKALTDRFIEAIKPTPDRQQIRDGGCKNLILIVQKTGAKSWAWRGRINGGAPQKFTLGGYPAFSLADARAWATDINRGRSEGVNVIEVKKAKAVVDATMAERTCDWLFALYMQHEGESRRSSGEKWRIYNREIKPEIGEMSIYLVTHETLDDLLWGRLEDAPSVSNAMKRLMSRWFRWAVTIGRSVSGLKANPAADLVLLAKPGKRTRFLSDYELGLLLRVLDTTATKFADPFKLLINTGCRKMEVFEAAWSELDALDTTGDWTIPGARVKNGKTNVVWLNPDMVAMLKGIREKRSNLPLVWPGSGDPEKAMGGYTRALRQISNEMAALAALDGIEIPHWTIHDLRRTVSTGLNSLKDENDNARVLPIVVEKVLNHISGTEAGVAGLYNQWAYYGEKKAALRLWAGHLAAIKALSISAATTKTLRQAA
jgi:integrase